MSKRKSPPQNLRLNLLENGIDFIRSAIQDHFFDDGARPEAYKYAVLHMYAGVLLLLKEKIRRELPLLLFTGRGKTLNFGEIQRTLPLAGVTLSQEAQDTLETFQKLRNVLEHYECDLDLSTTQSHLGRLAAFAYFFMWDHLGEDLAKHLNPSTAHRLMDLKEIFERRLSERDAEWRSRAKPLFAISDDEVLRLLGEVDGYDANNNPYPDELVECPECSEQAVLMVERDTGLCTNLECKQVFHADECLRCDAPVFYGAVFCDMCSDYIAAD